MTDRPIIFSAPMVMALLAGRKTQTRRLAWKELADEWGAYAGERKTTWQSVQHGHRLWVRENWALDLQGAGEAPIEPRRALYAATDSWEGPTVPSIHMPRWASRITLTVTDVRRQRLQEISAEDAIAEGLASTTKDGKLVKYGIPDKDGLPGTNDHWWPWHDWRVSPVDAFERLWRSIHGDGAWQANPEVVALSFSVALRNIDAQEAA